MRRYEITSGSRKFKIDLSTSAKVILNGMTYETEFSITESGIVILTMNGTNHRVFCKKLSESQYEIYYKHHIIPVELSDDKRKLVSNLEKSRATNRSTVIIKAPMPGLVASVEVRIGETVAPGKGLLILEAMKMENEIRSAVHGTIKRIEVKERSTVEKDQPLLLIEVLP